MGIHRGPNTVKDGLVFGYDTGYGVADNSTATRFYPGKPATNLITSGLPGYFGSGGETLYQKTLNGFTSNSGVFQRNFVNNPNTGNNAGLYKNFNTAALNSSTGYIQVSFDFYMITPYVRSGQAGTGLNGYLRVQSTDGTFDNYGWDSRYSNGSGDDWNNNSAYVGQWQKVSLFVDLRDDKTPSAINAMYIYVDFATQGEGIYTNFIITEHATIPVSPVLYTETSRSSTASLIDLKKTTDIDVSNVSFDSTGQPTFDNTDDRITMPNSSVFNHTSELSIEAWVKFVGNNNDFIFEKGNVNTQYSLFSHGSDIVFRTWHAGDSGYQSLAPSKTTAGITNGQWHHIVGSWDGSTKRIYVDGVDKASVSKSGALTTNSNGAAIGSFGGTSSGYYFGGDIAIVKIYDKGLSATEIKQNFNAYKNRFDI